MKKKLIGACPCCGHATAIDLSALLELPIRLPHECNSCDTALQVSPKHPRLTRAAKILAYIVFYALYWLNEQSPAAFAFGVLGFLSMYLLVNRTLGSPTLVIDKPKRDFLDEELENNESTNPN